MCSSPCVSFHSGAVHSAENVTVQVILHISDCVCVRAVGECVLSIKPREKAEEMELNFQQVSVCDI